LKDWWRAEWAWARSWCARGWKSRQMVERYAKSTAERRAREAHRRMSLGTDLSSIT